MTKRRARQVHCKNPDCVRKFQFRPGKLFCSPSCKFKTWSARRRGILEASKVDASWRSYDPCYYCGGPGETVDHTPPISVREQMDESKSPWPYVEVRACRECQMILNHRPPYDLEGRRAKVSEKLGEKYASLLRMSSWSGGELDELGPDLRAYIEESKVLKKAIEKRMAWKGPEEEE